MSKTFFFCGIGGSGMSALALIMAKHGINITGSDRSRDQGQTPDKFKALEALGIKLFPQDGSGVKGADALIVSTAVEDSIPDIKAAKEQGIQILKRAELLAQIFNESPCGVSVAGTSGKSTVTGMIATILTAAGRDPTVMNGGIMLNFIGDKDSGLGNMRAGGGKMFVAETDESDGSIALYDPAISVLNNIALDHKSIEELDVLFSEYIARTSKAVVVNRDDARAYGMAGKAKVPVIDYSVKDKSATLYAEKIATAPDGVAFEVQRHAIKLHVPGLHNVSNALAALGAAQALDMDLKTAIKGLESFKGIRRRLEVTGSKNGITVIDDFAHNPDKISASLKTLKEFPERLIVMFQPHGFGPLKMMGREIAQVFCDYLRPGDLVFMPEAYYAGGTADRSVTAQDVIAWMKEGGVTAEWFATRAEILPSIVQSAKRGDRVVIMGARDDTLSVFAKEILSKL